MKQSKLSRTLMTVLLVFLAIVCMLPMLMVLINSFKTHQDIVRNPLAVFLQALQTILRRGTTENLAARF